VNAIEAAPFLEPGLGQSIDPRLRRQRPMKQMLKLAAISTVNTGKQVGDVDHLKVFANEDAAEKWFAENDPEDVAFEYEVLE
jgi:hypothetical protein